VTGRVLPGCLLVVACSVLGALACVPASEAGRTELATVQQELNDLRAREQIRELFGRYGRTLDERDFDGFGRLFARDAEFKGGNGTAHGPQAIAALLKQSITRGATGPTGPNLHVFSNELIDVHGEQATATSRGAFFVQNDQGRPAALIFATYRDQLVVEDGIWKFKRREIVSDIPGPPR
jgi:3-phenylpropionate/cinnamic acid dioxygenase small subunit